MRVEAYDSAGVEMVVNWGERADYSRLGVLESSPSVRIGTAVGIEGDAFGHIRVAKTAPDGRIVVLDDQVLHLRVFTAEGSFLTEMGARGFGPGEFQSSTALPYLGTDSVWVWDARLQRVSVFSLDGSLGRVFGFRAEPIRALRTMRMKSDEMTVLSVHRSSMPPSTALSAGLQVRRDSAVFTTHAVGGRILDTIAILPILESVQEVTEDGGLRLMTLPLGAQGLYVETEDGIVGGFGNEFRIEWWRTSEGLTRAVHFPAMRVRLSTADRAWSRSRASSSPGRFEDVDDGGMPEYRPVFSGLVRAKDGDVWVREHDVWGEAGSIRWWRVAAESGAIVGYLQVPTDLRVFEIESDYVLGARERDLVPVVERYQVVPHQADGEVH